MGPWQGAFQLIFALDCVHAVRIHAPMLLQLFQTILIPPFLSPSAWNFQVTRRGVFCGAPSQLQWRTLWRRTHQTSYCVQEEGPQERGSQGGHCLWHIRYNEMIRGEMRWWFLFWCFFWERERERAESISLHKPFDQLTDSTFTWCLMALSGEEKREDGTPCLELLNV